MREARREERKDRILEAAVELFRQYGFKKTSLEEIAAAAGVSKATLYHYVDGKDELFGEVVRKFHGEFVSDLKSQLALERTPMAKVRRYAHELVERSKLLHRFLGPPGDGGRVPVEFKHLKRCAEIEISILQEILSEGMASGHFREMDLDSVAVLLFSTFRGLVAQHFRNPGSEAETVDQFLSVLFNGILDESSREGKK